MDSSNIATVVGPNVFPISEKVDAKNKLMITKSCNIIRIMIENSHHIGEIPDYIIEQIGSSTTSGHNMNIDMKLKRRSGSFTRIFHGLKKMVGNKADEELLSNTVTPDLLLTPTFYHSGKRQYENTLPRSKKREDIWNRKSETNKPLNRRWSSIAQVSARKKKRNSLIDTSSKEFKEFMGSEKSRNLNDHLKVSEKEYEDIKNRVCKIEKELSRELENVKPKSLCDNINIGFDINNIQSVYEQTLVQTEPLSPTTDHLARRLSRELRIRTSEQKIIRSPSARKIGNMKRRSRELERPNNKIFKSSSFQFANINNSNSDSTSRLSSDDIKSINGHVEYYGAHKLTNVSHKLSSRLSLDSFDRTQINDIITDNYVNSKLLSSSASQLGLNGCTTNLIETNTKSVSLESLSGNIFFGNNLDKNPANHNGKVKFSKLKDKSIKPNAPPVKRSVNLKQKRKNEKVYPYMKRLNVNSKENIIFPEDPVKSNVKCLDRWPSTNVPYIKKLLIVKSPKRACGTLSVKNTPLKVLSASQRVNTNISF